VEIETVLLWTALASIDVQLYGNFTDTELQKHKPEREIPGWIQEFLNPQTESEKAHSRKQDKFVGGPTWHDAAAESMSTVQDPRLKSLMAREVKGIKKKVEKLITSQHIRLLEEMASKDDQSAERNSEESRPESQRILHDFMSGTSASFGPSPAAARHSSPEQSADTDGSSTHAQGKGIFGDDLSSRRDELASRLRAHEWSEERKREFAMQTARGVMARLTERDRLLLAKQSLLQHLGATGAKRESRAGDWVPSRRGRSGSGESERTQRSHIADEPRKRDLRNMIHSLYPGALENSSPSLEELNTRATDADPTQRAATTTGHDKEHKSVRASTATPGGLSAEQMLLLQRLLAAAHHANSMAVTSRTASDDQVAAQDAAPLESGLQGVGGATPVSPADTTSASSSVSETDVGNATNSTVVKKDIVVSQLEIRDIDLAHGCLCFSRYT